jgi:hypothetical protein
VGVYTFLYVRTNGHVLLVSYIMRIVMYFIDAVY